MWKPLLDKNILKTLREDSKGRAQRGQYLLAVSLGGYKWYQGQTPGNMPAMMLGSGGVDCEIPRWLGTRTNIFLQGYGNVSLSRHVLKTLRGSPKKKAQRAISASGGVWAVTSLNFRFFHFWCKVIDCFSCLSTFRQQHIYQWRHWREGYLHQRATFGVSELFF